MGRRRALIAGLALAWSVAAFVLLRGDSDERVVGTRPISAEPLQTPGVPALVAAAPGAPATDLPLLPRSLGGTDVDGGLSVDSDGHFVPTADAIALFDYFFAASGEEPPEVIVARIRAEIRSLLLPPADAEAEALLDRYVAFRAAVRQLVASGEPPGDLERRLQWIRELRREHFGADAEALFGEAERVAAIDLERRRVASDVSLHDDERRSRLEALDAQLPERTREARARARAPANARAEVEALRAQGGSEREVFAVREQYFGAEAAERLAAMDAEQQAWRDRLAAYRVERDALLAEHEAAGSPDEIRRRALEQLRHAHFEPDEIRRVSALDGRL